MTGSGTGYQGRESGGPRGYIRTRVQIERATPSKANSRTVLDRWPSINGCESRHRFTSFCRLGGWCDLDPSLAAESVPVGPPFGSPGLGFDGAHVRLKNRYPHVRARKTHRVHRRACRPSREMDRFYRLKSALRLASV